MQQTQNSQYNEKQTNKKNKTEGLELLDLKNYHEFTKIKTV